MSEYLSPLCRLNVSESRIEQNGPAGHASVPCEDYYLNKLEELKEAFQYDSEEWHREVDKLLIQAIKSFGWKKFYEKYKEAEKYFYYC